MQGTVTDGKAGLAGATVIALHTPTGTKYTTTTRKDGRFNLPGLRVGGPYIISVSYVGFKEEKQENVFLVLGQDFYADFTMTFPADTFQNGDQDHREFYLRAYPEQRNG
ncbi:MAG TPA: carboxypeptidase-like regulatory domain-containing protein [Puia sp.]|nr:carboxypeptidase-like regulatory domain-containing protein [Puia sp.]